jgi:hypothetical protein
VLEDHKRDTGAPFAPDIDGLSRTELRTNVLFAYGANLKVAQELLAYNDTRFDHTAFHTGGRFALADELHVETWREYAAQAASDGAWATLRRRLPQLSFPIRAGISQSETYLNATRRGIGVGGMAEAEGLTLQAPQLLRLEIHPTPAGAVPLLHTGCREDFVALIQALTRSNEPAPIPPSLGAMLVAGYVNWDRIRRLREQWEREREGTADTSESAWMEELRTQIKPHRHLYQDTFILLTDTPYSGVPAGALGLTEAEWRAISVRIRVAHETTHYLTRRLFGSARNNILDELIADYAGIVAGCGHYRADWFLRFMGLEAFPTYRDSGRLSYYRGQPPLSDVAFGLLQKLVKAAAENLERFDREHGRSARGAEAHIGLLATLTQLTLEELALPDASDRIARRLHAADVSAVT